MFNLARIRTNRCESSVEDNAAPLFFESEVDGERTTSTARQISDSSCQKKCQRKINKCLDYYMEIYSSFHASGSEPEMLVSLAQSSHADTRAHEDMHKWLKSLTTENRMEK